MIKDQGYGETEPNDHIVNADGLLLGRFYHANSFDQFDEDWYYITTDKKNQKLTVHFLGDSGNYADTTGWVIRIRDLKGNVIAAFDSSTTGGAGIEGGPAEGGSDTSPVEAAKITEVTLGKISSYYISVKSKDDAGRLRGYNIGATLKDTGQVTADYEDAPFDTETEPNDDKKNADVLRSNVAMVGVFDRTLIKRVEITTPAETEIKYFYKGCSLNDPNTIPLGNTNCECIIKNNPVDPENTNPEATDQTPAGACEAKEVTTPAKTEWRGIFQYDKDVYVYHSKGNEQLRVQVCTRTECEFDRVHLRINKGGTSIVLLDGPIEPMAST